MSVLVSTMFAILRISSLQIFFLICLLGFFSSVHAASPRVNQFGWSPSTIHVGESSTFVWSISNVQSCKSEISGPQSISGSIGPITVNSAGSSTTQWSCTDLDGNRYPSSGFLEATRVTIERPAPNPSPVVNDFAWNPSTLYVGESTTFEWDVSNVQHCISTYNSTKGPSGMISAIATNTGDTISEWYCIDLDGNRYDSANLKAKYTAVERPNKNYFRWTKSTATVGEKVYFEWDIQNVQSCNSEFSGEQATNGRVARTFDSTGSYITQWTCTDLLNNTYTVTADPLDIVLPSPVKHDFSWSPSELKPGQSSTFTWNIANVSGCESPISGAQLSSGTIDYVANSVGSSTTLWHCTDLNGNRYPASGYLEAPRTTSKFDAPALISLAKVARGGHEISWSNISHATSYQLKERFNDEDWQVVPETISTNTTTLYGRLAGDYQYQVSACANIDGQVRCDMADVGTSERDTFFLDPEVVKFEWDRNPINVGEKSAFTWEIYNVISCESSKDNNGRDSSGSTQNIVHTSAGEVITEWFCFDLANVRYPYDGSFITTRLEVESNGILSVTKDTETNRDILHWNGDISKYQSVIVEKNINKRTLPLEDNQLFWIEIGEWKAGTKYFLAESEIAAQYVGVYQYRIKACTATDVCEYSNVLTKTIETDFCPIP